jgi:hypothetical protein
MEVQLALSGREKQAQVKSAKITLIRSVKRCVNSDRKMNDDGRK